MHHSAIAPKRPLLFHVTLSENPPLKLPMPLSPSLDARWHPRCASSFSCRGGGDALAARLHRSAAPPGSATAGYGGWGRCVGGEEVRSIAAKDVDVATLGNLCVDIVLNVPALPPPSKEERKAYMEELSASPPDKQYWEAGGNCNTAIAAARLGLNCTAIGHVGNEIYGKFLIDVLQDEGIRMVGMNEDASVDNSSASYETLLCWVLVDPLQRHGFCSRADFRKEPAFSWLNKLSAEVKLAITRSKILFCNGYGFDELCPDLIASALDYSVEVGTSIFFDPGPRGKSLSKGTLEERRALRKILQMSDVLLLTSDEAESLTGINDPILAGQELLKQGVRMKWVVIKMGARGSIIITGSSISCAPAFKVNVVDTVGCGDSFVAAIAYGFIHNIPLMNTLALANAVGAATAMGCGAGRSVAKLDQAIELMNVSNLNEDDEFWNLVLGEKLDSCDISILSEMVINGKSAQVNRVPLQKVVSELLPELEPARLKSSVTF
ncbi:PfkB domain-containing protein [Psidium guajava]|nr:PfkB domain-containing protein [Psidium guajava]